MGIFNDGATGMVFLPDGSKAYLDSFANAPLQQYDPVANTFLAIPVGDDQLSVESGITPDGTTLYISNNPAIGDSQIIVLDTSTNVVTTTIPAPGDLPAEIAVCSPPPPSVPTVSEWGMIVMVCVFALAALVFLRRRVVA